MASLVFSILFLAVLAMSSSRDSYQCSSIQDDAEEAEGLSPTSIWKKEKRKDYSDEDYDPEEEEETKEEEDEEEPEEEDEEEPEEEEEGQVPIANNQVSEEPLPPPILVAAIKEIPPPVNMRRTARMSTGGKAPRHCLAAPTPVANVFRREIMHVPAEDLPGEWDRHLPKRVAKEASSGWMEWKPSKEYVGKQLWDNLTMRTREFRQAYSLMMDVIKDIQKNYQPEEFKKKK